MYKKICSVYRLSPEVQVSSLGNVFNCCVSTDEAGYNIGLYDTSSIASDILW
jgi:hypothetical protein